MNIPSRIWPLLLIITFVVSCSAAQSPGDEEVWAPTPPRLSYLEGEVSYWRPGEEDWAVAHINLPLADGDALYAGKDANFEVQFDPRSFVRADENSELTFAGQEEGLVHFKVASGRVSFDMRRIPMGTSVEVSTPGAVFLIDNPGYYRVEVGSSTIHFITRHGGQATVTTADGRSLAIYPSEDIVVTTGEPVQVTTYAAPLPDAWDRWNDERTDQIGESVSDRYLSPGIYGAEELDHYGHWRVVATYGNVWIPGGVSATWVPYSTGYWIWDPYYEWTWVDNEPWGWAPFHYGRWVLIDGYWAWAPGPIVRHAIYSPALVAFIKPTPSVSVGIGIGLPALWWVALGWGEPVIPWWHHHKHYGHPRWDGWGGPHIINNRQIMANQFFNVNDIHYRNAERPHAIRSMPVEKFGRERVRIGEEDRYRSRDFTPLRGEVPVKPSRASLYGGAPKGIQPPREIVSRPVVSLRPPRQPAPRPWQGQGPRATPSQKKPEVIYMVPPGQRREGGRSLPRPPYGPDGGPELPIPPQPPRYGDVKRSTGPSAPVLRTFPGGVRETPEGVTPGRPEPALRLRPGTVIPKAPERTAPSQRPPVRLQPETPQQGQRRIPMRAPTGDRERRLSRPPSSQPQQGERHLQRREQRQLPGQPANQPFRKFLRN